MSSGLLRRAKAADLGEDFFSPRASAETEESVRGIIAKVRAEGDAALAELSLKYDAYSGPLAVPPEELEARRAWLEESDPELANALRVSMTNIRSFANRQFAQFQDFEMETAPGVHASQRVLPLDSVGVYVPGGRYPLVSTLLMCAIPAQVAGVGRIAVCTPAGKDGGVAPMVLAACAMLGLKEVYAVGGAQAVAAMAYGTQTIGRVAKIVGPGNRYVTMAKREVFGVCGIDFLAGPSEVMILADDSAKADWVAADLLAQAEHDADAQAMLVSLSEPFVDLVEEALAARLAELPTKEVAALSLERNGMAILAASEEEAIEVANRRAPEHLEIAVRYPDSLAKAARNYGTMFVGCHAAEVLGDYSAGTNHSLPTGGAARYTAGLSVREFVRLLTGLRAGPGTGFERVAKAAAKLGDAEGLAGHAAAARARLSR